MTDSLQPLDLTLLDKHFGDIKQWQNTVDEIHKRGMYVILDHTFSTYVTPVPPLSCEMGF